MQRKQLQLLSYLAPAIAGKIATRLFSQSRNQANEYRRALTPMGARCLPIKATDHRVENIYLWGDSGDIVLLVHGWGSNCSSMFGFVDGLLAQGYRVATFDAPAHGCTPGQYTTMSEYLTATNHVLNQLGQLGHVRCIVAHSLGSIVAMAAAATHASIERLTLISAPCSLLDVLDIWSAGFMQLRDRIRQRILKQLLADNGVPVSHWDVRLHGKYWDKPVQIIHDKNDNVVAPGHAQLINKSLPQTQLSLTEGLGHARILMSPEVHHQVSQFITSQPQQRTIAV